jgi:hypothetical protein
VSLELVPCSISDAKEFVRQHHRHASPPVSGLFAVGATHRTGELNGFIVGVAIIGRPVARQLQDGFTAEVTRLTVLPGLRNVCSLLYGAAWRACRALGYRRLVTYTLDSETGTSLLASGFRVVAQVKAESWSRAARSRVDRAPLQAKWRWEVSA